MLKDRILSDMKEAMKAGDKARLSAIRMLRAAIKDREIELGHPLSDAEVHEVLSRLVKQREDSAAKYAEAGREDLRAKEQAEADLFRAYLPEPLSEQELEALIEQAIAETGASSVREMGKVMAWVKTRAAGRADMAQVARIVRARLS